MHKFETKYMRKWTETTINKTDFYFLCVDRDKMTQMYSVEMDVFKF